MYTPSGRTVYDTSVQMNTVWSHLMLACIHSVVIPLMPCLFVCKQCGITFKTLPAGIAACIGTCLSILDGTCNCTSKTKQRSQAHHAEKSKVPKCTFSVDVASL
jgi:hypothetical protein